MGEDLGNEIWLCLLYVKAEARQAEKFTFLVPLKRTVSLALELMSSADMYLFSKIPC